MNIEELGASNPGGWLSSIVDGLWYTGMLAVAYLFAKPSIYRMFGWELPPEAAVATDDKDDDQQWPGW